VRNRAGDGCSPGDSRGGNMENGATLSRFAEEMLVFLFSAIGVSDTGLVSREILCGHFNDRDEEAVRAAIAELENAGLIRCAKSGITLNGQAYVYLRDEGVSRDGGSPQRGLRRHLIPVIVELFLVLAAVLVFALLEP